MADQVTGDGGTVVPTMVPVKVNGVDEQVPLEKLVSAYAKVAGADQKFEDAARLRREADEKAKELEQLRAEATLAREAKELQAKIEQGDQQAYLTYCQKVLGLSAEDSFAALEQVKAQQAAATKAKPQAEATVDYAAIDPRTQATIHRLQQQLEAYEKAGLTPDRAKQVLDANTQRDTLDHQKWFEEQAIKYNPKMGRLFGASPESRRDVWNRYEANLRSGAPHEAAIQKAVDAKVSQLDAELNALAPKTDMAGRVPSAGGISASYSRPVKPKIDELFGRKMNTRDYVSAIARAEIERGGGFNEQD
jgi:hypothetical protein